MTVGERIKLLREKLNINQVDFATKINVTKQTLYKYENDIITNIPFDKIEAIAKVCDVSPAYVMGWELMTCTTENITQNTIPTLDVFKTTSTTKFVTSIPVTTEIAQSKDFFGFEIPDDSMAPRIQQGDFVIVRRQNTAEHNDIIITQVNKEKATCKRLQKYAEGILLLSNNPKYDPFIFSDQDVEDEKVKIIGKVVELRAKF